MKQGFRAMKQTVIAATMAAKGSTIVHGRQSTDQGRNDGGSKALHVRHLHLMIVKVEETPMNGGKLARLERDKPLIYYTSSSKEDALNVLNTVADAADETTQARFEKVKLYGVGQAAWSRQNQRPHPGKIITSPTSHGGSKLTGGVSGYYL
jgi:hypothetical protein